MRTVTTADAWSLLFWLHCSRAAALALVVAEWAEGCPRLSRFLRLLRGPFVRRFLRLRFRWRRIGPLSLCNHVLGVELLHTPRNTQALANEPGYSRVHVSPGQHTRVRTNNYCSGPRIASRTGDRCGSLAYFFGSGRWNPAAAVLTDKDAFLWGVCLLCVSVCVVAVQMQICRCLRICA